MKLSKLLSPTYYRAPTLEERFKKHLVSLRWRRKIRLSIPKGFLEVGTIWVLFICIIGVFIQYQKLNKETQNLPIAIQAETAVQNQQERIESDKTSESESTIQYKENISSDSIDIVWTWTWQQDSSYKAVRSWIIWALMVIWFFGSLWLLFKKIKHRKKKW